MNAKEGLHLKKRNMQYDIDQCTQMKQVATLHCRRSVYLLASAQHHNI